MIRDYEVGDAQAIKYIHESQKFDYALPDINSPLVLVKKVREVDGRIVGAMLLRITCETYLFVEGSPEAKARSILELQPEVLKEAYRKGLSDIICVLPPEIASEFGPVMEDERLGWSRDRDWPMYSREICEIV